MPRAISHRFLLLLLVLAAATPAAADEGKITYKLGLLPGDAKDKRFDGDVFNSATDAFVATRRFTMVERKQINAVFTEKDLQEFIGGQVNNKLSDVLGLDLIGLVNYTVETTRPDKSGPPVTTWIIDVRLMDVKTAQILATISSNRPGLLIPPATAREAGKLLFKSIRDAFPPFGYVIRVDGKEAIVDLGSDAGVKDGDVLEVVQEGEQIIHPVSGQVLPAPLKVIGELKVVAADLQMSTCKRKSGKVEFKPADRVRLKDSKSIVPDWVLKIPQFKDELKRKRDAITN